MGDAISRCESIHLAGGRAGFGSATQLFMKNFVDINAHVSIKFLSVLSPKD